MYKHFPMFLCVEKFYTKSFILKTISVYYFFTIQLFIYLFMNTDTCAYNDFGVRIICNIYLNIIFVWV